MEVDLVGAAPLPIPLIHILFSPVENMKTSVVAMNDIEMRKQVDAWIKDRTSARTPTSKVQVMCAYDRRCFESCGPVSGMKCSRQNLR